jgi:hypothetical protein
LIYVLGKKKNARRKKEKKMQVRVETKKIGAKVDEAT